MPENPISLCQYTFVTLDREVKLQNGAVLPAGTKALLLPQTTAHSVRVPGEQSLAEAWESLARTNHTHPREQQNLAAYEAELIRLAHRVNQLELWAAKQGFTI